MAGYGDKNGKERTPRKSNSVATVDNAPFRGYINLTITEDQKRAFDKWQESASLWEVLEASVADGVNLAVKRDPKGSGFLSSATQRRVDSPNAGLVVTARGSSAATSWARLLYCLAILSRAERWEDVQPMADPDRW